MNLRRVTRFAALLLFLFSVTCSVLLINPGPRAVAEWMGESCKHNGISGEQCTTVDAVLFLGLGTPEMMLLGGATALALRPRGKATPTLDLSRVFRRVSG